MESDTNSLGHSGALAETAIDGQHRNGLVASLATGDGPQSYEFNEGPDGRSVSVHAPDGTGRNLRMVWRASNVARTLNHQACDTWGTTNGPIAQQGVALRIAEAGGSCVRALCVMKNIWNGGNWIFNAIGFSNGSFEVLGTVDLAEAFDPGGIIPSLPWRMCARVQGTSLQWKVWPTARAQPMWEDPKFGTTITLPSVWVYPGRPGFYLGHLEMGDDAAFADESVNTLPAAPSNQTIAFEACRC